MQSIILLALQLMASYALGCYVGYVMTLWDKPRAMQFNGRYMSNIARKGNVLVMILGTCFALYKVWY